MKGTKVITVCDTPNCGEEAAMGKCQGCMKDMCPSHAWGIFNPEEWGRLGLQRPSLYVCRDCLAPILGQRVETKEVAE